MYLLKGFTFTNYNIPLKDLVVGTTTGVINVNPQTYRISMVDDFELNDTFAPRNGANPPELRTTNFGGSPTWQDTNGADKFDFFIFEVGGNDEFAVQPILVGGALGQKVVVKAAQWLATAPEPLPDMKKSGGDNNGQQIAGIAFKITDLLGEDGKPLANDTIIEGLLFTSPGVDSLLHLRHDRDAGGLGTQACQRGHRGQRASPAAMVGRSQRRIGESLLQRQ